jgi:osmotically-inducible protein OsmY
VRSDGDILRDIGTELRERQCNEPSHVVAQAHCGVIRLTGSASTYCEKYAIERAVRDIEGVAGVVNDIEVQISPLAPLSDEQLRCEVLRALQTEVPAIFDRLTVSVHDGEVTLEGTVDYAFFHERAEMAVRRLGHVSTVHNAITLEPRALAQEVEQHIRQSLHAGVECSASASHGEITLTGIVSSDEARVLAEQAAWSVPGVLQVRNDLTVRR